MVELSATRLVGQEFTVRAATEAQQPGSCCSELFGLSETISQKGQGVTLRPSSTSSL